MEILFSSLSNEVIPIEFSPMSDAGRMKKYENDMIKIHSNRFSIEFELIPQGFSRQNVPHIYVANLKRCLLLLISDSSNHFFTGLVNLVLH